MHTNHADVHEVGLQDDCPDCAESAEEPWRHLDQEMLSQLIRRNYHYRFVGDYEQYMPRSDTEAIAMRNITTTMERMGQMMSNDPGGYIRSYLEKNWRVDFGG